MTHFFASTGTCGTITGTGSFLKEISGGRIKVHGIHPPRGHDIPGVRSIEQLKMTDHYKPTGYDELAEVSNQEAFDMCKRLNQEESLIAGPSSGMQVVGALKLMPDVPGNIGVVIFCDDIFKYTTSVTKHCPDVFPESGGPQFENAELKALGSILDAAKEGPDTLDSRALNDQLKPILQRGNGSAPLLIDVRPHDEFESRLRPVGAINIPMSVFNGQDEESDVVQVFDLPGAVQRKAGSGKPSKSARECVDDALRSGLGRGVLHDENIVLYCNRAVDSTFVMLRLKALGFCNVKQVGFGMFGWRDAGMPTENDPRLVKMPPASNAEEEALLARHGYNKEGDPQVSRTACAS